MANTKDQNSDAEFPGYPHYPAREDIMGSGGNERADIDIENLSRSGGMPFSVADAATMPAQITNEDAALDGEEKVDEADDADITQEDLMALGEEDTNFAPVEQIAGNDLDVPGSDEDDANEEIGEEDEENNYYSLGGDDHGDLEEDREG